MTRRLTLALTALCLTTSLAGALLGWLAHERYAPPEDKDPVIVLVPQPGDCGEGRQKT